jgi:hypothetical protein
MRKHNTIDVLLCPLVILSQLSIQLNCIKVHQSDYLRQMSLENRFIYIQAV